MPLSSRTLFLGIFSTLLLAVTLITFSLRKDTAPVFNETGVILQIRDMVRQQNIHTLSEFYARNSLTIWKETPDNHKARPIQAHFYRPLEILAGSFIVLSSHILYDLPWLPVLINSFFLGLAGASLFALSYVFLKDFRISVSAAIFMIFSLPSLNATWQTIGIHALVPLTIHSAVISYVRFKKTHHPGWLVPVFLSCAAGPLYKEYTGVISLMLLLCECLDQKKDWRLLTLFAAFFCYSLSPAFWLNLVGHQTLTFTSSYLSLRIWERIITLNFKFHFFSHFLFTLPPTVVFFGLLSVFANIFDLYNKNLVWKTTGLLLAAGCFFLLMASTSPATPGIILVTSFVIIAISFSALRIHRIFPVIFIVSWLPCLIVFLNEVYLMYSLGLLAVILLFNIRIFLQHLLSCRQTKLAQGLGILVLLGLLTGLADQALNLLTVQRTASGISQLTSRLGKALAQDIEKAAPETNATFLSNNRFAKDLQFILYKNNRIDLPVNAVYSFELDPAYDSSLNRLFGLLLHTPLTANVYFLNSDNSFNIKGSRISLQEDRNYSLVALAEQNITVRYPYFDPLKLWMPARLASFPGNPDLEIYFQKRQGPFWRETSCSLILYRLRPDSFSETLAEKDQKSK